MNSVEKSHLHDTFTTLPIRVAAVEQQAHVAAARRKIETASYQELRGLLETMADALQKHGALRLMIDVAKERLDERKTGPELVHLAARQSAEFPGGVA